MTDYKLDVIPEYASDAVINFNSHSLAGYKFHGLFNKLALFKSSDLGSLASGSVSPAVDAFGCQRVSVVYTLGD